MTRTLRVALIRGGLIGATALVLLMVLTSSPFAPIALSALFCAALFASLAMVELTWSTRARSGPQRLLLSGASWVVAALGLGSLRFQVEYSTAVADTASLTAGMQAAAQSVSQLHWSEIGAMFAVTIGVLAAVHGRLSGLNWGLQIVLALLGAGLLSAAMGGPTYFAARSRSSDADFLGSVGFAAVIFVASVPFCVGVPAAYWLADLVDAWLFAPGENDAVASRTSSRRRVRAAMALVTALLVAGYLLVRPGHVAVSGTWAYRAYGPVQHEVRLDVHSPKWGDRQVSDLSITNVIVDDTPIGSTWRDPRDVYPRALSTGNSFGGGSGLLFRHTLRRGFFLLSSRAQHLRVEGVVLTVTGERIPFSLDLDPDGRAESDL